MMSHGNVPDNESWKSCDLMTLSHSGIFPFVLIVLGLSFVLLFSFVSLIWIDLVTRCIAFSPGYKRPPCFSAFSIVS